MLVLKSESMEGKQKKYQANISVLGSGRVINEMLFHKQINVKQIFHELLMIFVWMIWTWIDLMEQKQL